MNAILLISGLVRSLILFTLLVDGVSVQTYMQLTIDIMEHELYIEMYIFTEASCDWICQTNK